MLEARFSIGLARESACSADILRALEFRKPTSIVMAGRLEIGDTAGGNLHYGATLTASPDHT